MSRHFLHSVTVCDRCDVYTLVMATRAEHRAQTLRKISEGAVSAIEEFGPDVSLDVIAERSGVARRTVYRWVDSKDDLLFIHPKLWIDIFDAAVDDVADSSARERVLHGAKHVTQAIDDDPEPVRRSMELALMHPELMRGYAAMSAEWVDRMALELGARSSERAERFQGRVLGAAVMAVIDTALAEWLIADPNVPLAGLIDEGLAIITPILDSLDT